MARKPDITVMGGGIFGLSCAWEMARRGARVRLIEAQHIGAGASGGVVGALAPHVPERWNAVKAFQFDSLLAAEGFWRAVREESGLDPGYARTGRLQPIADDAARSLAEDRAAQAATLWRGQAAWRVIDAAEAGGWAPASPTGLLIADTLSARIDPNRACAALADALRAQGAEIALGASDPEGGPVLWATGAAGLDALSAGRARPVGRAVKGQAALLAHIHPDAPQIYADGLHIVPHADGTTAVGSTTERYFADSRTTDAQLDDVIARACAVVPVLEGAPVIRRWAGLRPRARSRAPMLGPWPGRPDHFIANGGFKIGFGVAPVAAALMADLILEGRERIPNDFAVEASL